MLDYRPQFVLIITSSYERFNRNISSGNGDKANQEERNMYLASVVTVVIFAGSTEHFSAGHKNRFHYTKAPIGYNNNINTENFPLFSSPKINGFEFIAQ